MAEAVRARRLDVTARRVETLAALESLLGRARSRQREVARGSAA
jgi:hypothetical protein